MAYLGHIRNNEDGTVRNQLLSVHCRNTAGIAKESVSDAGLGNSAYLAGLLHDAGKYTADFQNYLLGISGAARGSVIHTFQGCKFMMDEYRARDNFSEVTAEAIAFAIGAHHGLFDCVDETKKIGIKYRIEKDGIGYGEALSAFKNDCADKSELDELFAASEKEWSGFLSRLDEQYPDDAELCFEVGMAVRLLLSAVIEGDRKDTAVFMNDEAFTKYSGDMRPLWKARLAHLENKLDGFSNVTPIDNARRFISDRCREFAVKPGDIYQLNVPTGSGKTISSLRYALAHAAEYNKKRIVFTSPLLSILEQNASVIRNYVGDDSIILEHHSNVVITDDSPEGALDNRELLVQTWDSPIIVTTLVQLLNTLFSGKTTAIRRLHSLCNSVIVIDEVQSVPTKMLTLFNLAIRFLNEQCGATVVLCSATQPGLNHAEHPLPKKPEDIVPYDKSIWEAFKRTEITPLPGVKENDLSNLIKSLMEDTRSLLVVCNKKSEAAKLAKETEDSQWKSVHLSAGMCVQHRRDALNSLYKTLECGERILCISTQVIEAGVDISFQKVLRLSAGMDSVIQSAGRCNRNGESKDVQPVWIVNCKDEKLGKLTEIKQGKTATALLMNAYGEDPGKFNASLSSEESIDYYYLNLYRSMPVNAQDFPSGQGNGTLFDLLSCNEKNADENCEGIEEFCLYQAFKTAGSLFSVFDEDTTDVIVPYGEGKKIISSLCSEQAKHDIAYRSALLKKAGAYSASLYAFQKKKLEQLGGIYTICGSDTQPFALALQERFYNGITGVTENADDNTFWEV